MCVCVGVGVGVGVAVLLLTFRSIMTKCPDNVVFERTKMKGRKDKP